MKKYTTIKVSISSMQRNMFKTDTIKVEGYFGCTPLWHDKPMKCAKFINFKGKLDFFGK